MFVDERRRYIYCRIGKVASTTWSRVLLLASGKVNVIIAIAQDYQR
jgi:Sulfotransferase family